MSNTYAFENIIFGTPNVDEHARFLDNFCRFLQYADHFTHFMHISLENELDVDQLYSIQVILSDLNDFSLAIRDYMSELNRANLTINEVILITEMIDHYGTIMNLIDNLLELLADED